MRVALEKYGLLYLFFLLLILGLSLIYIFKNKQQNLTFAVLNIGQGDAIFIESPSGVQVLVDAGRDMKVLSELSRVMSFFDRSIDIAIMTNPDLDHIGGFISVFEKYKVDKVFEPGTYNDSEIYKKLDKEIKDKNIKRFLARTFSRIDLGGGVYLDILFPDRDVSTWENNDGSIVARLVYGDNVIMLTGDASIKTEKILLDKFSNDVLKSNIIKIGHHGSRTSSSLDFLKIVNPEYAVISSGKGNRYSHPHKEVLDFLSNLNIKILRTDQMGTIVFTCDKIELCKLK